MTYSISFLVTGLFIWSISSCQIYWHIIVHSVFSCIFNFCRIHCDFFFISYFVYLGFFLSFPWWCWPEICQFCLLFQWTSSWYYLFFIVFWISILLISFLIFMIPFLLLTLGYVCSSFSNLFRWWVNLPFQDFLLFRGRLLLLGISL